MAVRKERRPRQKTYPGPNPEDNQQMLQDIKDSIATDSSSSNSRPISSGGLEDMRTERSLDRERPESRGLEQGGGRRERRSPPGDREQASPSGTATPRSQHQQQNRSTPTKQLTQLNSDRNQKQLREIRKSLRPWVKSDPGFHSSKDQVNITMLEQLISLGHSEVGFFLFFFLHA